jgi:hypothetical protein
LNQCLDVKDFSILEIVGLKAKRRERYIAYPHLTVSQNFVLFELLPLSEGAQALLPL